MVDFRAKFPFTFAIMLGDNTYGSEGVVFTDHEHLYERVKPQQGIYHFVAGGSANLGRGDLTKSPLTDVGFDRDCPFMRVDIAGDEPFFQIITRAGNTIDRGVIARSRP